MLNKERQLHRIIIDTCANVKKINSSIEKIEEGSGRTNFCISPAETRSEYTLNSNQKFYTHPIY